MQKAATVGREIEQEHTVMANAGTVDVKQLSDTLHLIVLYVVIKPARTYRHVGFGRYVCVAAQHTVVEAVDMAGFIADTNLVGRSPAGITAVAGFVAHPAYIGKGI